MTRPHTLFGLGRQALIGLCITLGAGILFLANVAHLSAGLQRLVHGRGLLLPSVRSRPSFRSQSADVAAEKEVVMRPVKASDKVMRRAVPRPADALSGALQSPMMMPVAVNVVGGGAQLDFELELCTLDLREYHAAPSAFPMNADLIRAFCPRGATNKQRLDEMVKDQEWAGRRVEPSGFIVHESRVGSTLVANMLASAPVNLVYSEPRVPFDMIRLCKGCSEEHLVGLLRDTILVMGQSQHHEQYFIKFQSAMVQHMHLIIKAFPDTPWVFIYRDPVEVMVSNFRRGSTGPCIRSMHDPPVAVQRVLGVEMEGPEAAKTASKEEYCAAHLAMLCETALHHLNVEGSKGLAVSYEDLPSDFVNVIIPGHFGVALSDEEQARMLDESRVYSKSRSDEHTFMGDSDAKRAAASNKVVAAAEKYLSRRTAMLQAARERARSEVERAAKLRQQEAYVYGSTGSRFYDLPHCPDTPEYPPSYPLVGMLEGWNPDEVDIPARHYNSLCRLDYGTDYEKALRYRDAEVPFVVRNIPDLESTVEKWNTPGYIEDRLGGKTYHTEVSTSNHFMYYRVPARRASSSFRTPTTATEMTYEQWRGLAESLKNASSKDVHYYFRVSDPENEAVSDDLTIFRPEESLFVKEPDYQRGIHCRFGMRGVIAEGHFDSSRNMVAMLSGTRRWILAHPSECANAYLYPVRHPSGRHSQVDWSKPDLEKFPKFREMSATEVILTPGDVLYVPAWWIHFVVNLDINCQCNTRSGDADVGLSYLHACGFNLDVHGKILK